MNKIKIISSVSLGVAASSISPFSGVGVSAISETTYSITSDAYDISYVDDTITLKFHNTNIHNSVSDIKLVSSSTNKSFSFTKDSSNFKLKISKENLSAGVYNLVFNTKVSSSSSLKELYSPVYVSSPDLSTLDVTVTSLNPIISFVNSNGTYKVNAKFSLLNIKDSITSARLIDENNSQVGYLESISNPRNLTFNLGSSSLVSGDIYYVEYTLTDSNNRSKTLKVPFSYSSNSVQLTSATTNEFTYTSTKNSEDSVDLSLKFTNVDRNNIRFFDANNLSVSLVPTTDSDGRLVLKDLSVDKVIRVEIMNGTHNEILNFKVPSNSTSTETPIPFLKLVNASGLNLKYGTKINVPIVKGDLDSLGFTTPNTYIKFVYYDSLGNEIDLTNEARVSLSSYQAELTTNSNFLNVENTSIVYAKVYTPTKSVVFPFVVSNSSSTSQALAFDVIKNSSANNSSVSLTFKPNSSFISSSETFSDSDMLIVNNSFTAKLSSDKKSFDISIPKDKLINGTNTYTFIRNSSGGTVSFTGEFMSNMSSTEMKITPLIKDLSPTTNNDKELVIKMSVDDNYISSNLYTSVKITDEYGKSISLKSSVKGSSFDKYVEMIIEPPSQLIAGRTYTLQVNTGTNSFKTNFVYNASGSYNLNLDLTFNGFSTFTVANLSKIPGYALYDFNLKIYDYYDSSDVLYENFSQSYYGESFKSDNIKRDLKSGKSFIDGNKYTVELRNTATGDVYKQTFTFRQNSISDQGTDTTLQSSISSSSFTYSNNSINFSYSIPNNRTVTNITSSIPELKVSFSNGRMHVDGLVPSKFYRNLYLTIKFSDNTVQNVKLDDFTAQVSSDPLKNYLANVYTSTLTPVGETDKYKFRYADEAGFNYWYGLLYNRQITGSEFIFRILDSSEFNSVHSSAEDKTRALYKVIVNRDGDINGVNFWINEFTATLNSVNSQDVALRVTISKMLNENEPKQLFKNLGIRVE